MISPSCHFYGDGARLRLWPAVIKQYSNTRPRLVSSRRSASTISCLVTPGPWPPITASMLSTTVSVASRSFRSSSGVLRARSRPSVHLRRPERTERMLETLGPMADIGGLFGRASRVGQNRQVAARPHGFHVIEEKRAMTAEQILHVVLRRRDSDVNTGLSHQMIQQMVVKGQGRDSVLVLDPSQHGRLLAASADERLLSG